MSQGLLPWAWMLLPVIAQGLVVILHAVIGRLQPNRLLLNLLICAGAVFFLLSAAHLQLWALSEQKLDAMLYVGLNTLAYLGLVYGYFHFVNINIASLRLRLLRGIASSKEGISQESLLQEYGSSQIIDNRLERLINDGQIRECNGRYYLGNKRTFLILFWGFEALKLFVLGRGNQLLPAQEHGVRSVKQALQKINQWQFIRFLYVGVLNTLFGYSAYAFFFLIGLDYRIALTCSTISAILFNYFTNARFVFHQAGSGVLMKFIVLNCILYAMNQGALILLVTLSVNALIAQALIAPMIVISAFMINKFWVFRQGAPAAV